MTRFKLIVILLSVSFYSCRESPVKSTDRLSTDQKPCHLIRTVPASVGGMSAVQPLLGTIAGPKLLAETNTDAKSGFVISFLVTATSKSAKNFTLSDFHLRVDGEDYSQLTQYHLDKMYDWEMIIDDPNKFAKKSNCVFTTPTDQLSFVVTIKQPGAPIDPKSKVDFELHVGWSQQTEKHPFSLLASQFFYSE